MICTKCSQEKCDGFYANDKTCKECRCAMVRENRKAKLDYYRNYEKSRMMRPDRVAARKEYAKTPNGKKYTALRLKRWQQKHPQKRSAQITLGNAVRDKKIFRQPCEVCGEAKAQAHHDDYSKPLEVRWLCPKHHKPADRERRAREKQLNK